MTNPHDELDPAHLERLMEDVSRLPRDIAPSRDAWPVIRQRIEAQRVRAISADAPALRRRISPWWLAAAATVIATAGTMVTVANRGKSRETPPVAVDPVPVQPLQPSQLGVAPIVPIAAGFAEANPALAAALDQYQQATNDLETEVVARAGSMSPATREVVRRSLATIDTAIAELRTALGANPRDVGAGQSLSLVYERKLEFLKRVRSLPGTGM